MKLGVHRNERSKLAATELHSQIITRYHLLLPYRCENLNNTVIYLPYISNLLITLIAIVLINTEYLNPADRD